MYRLASSLFLSLAALAPPSQAQESHAAATLFVRAVEGRFEAAVEIEIDSGWHLYHDDLGPDDAVGEPTKLTFGGAEVEWQPPRFPEPHVFDQPFGKRGQPTWINGHEDFITIYAVGQPAAGAAPGDVTASVAGLTCTDEFCLPYRESDVASSGEGRAGLFDDFPYEAFGLAGEAAVDGDDSDGGDGEASSSEVLESPGATSWGGDLAGRAAARLFVRAAGDRFEAAIAIELDPGWHLYHDDLGPEDALGEPTRIHFGGAEVEWQAPVFPEPHRYDQPYGKNGEPTWINGHEGALTVYAVGRPAAGASPEEVTASVEGLTCSDEFCEEYFEDLASSGEGEAAVWRGFSGAASWLDGAGSGTGPGSDVGSGSRDAEAGTGSGSSPGPGSAEEPDTPLAYFLWLAVLGGLFALLMPCTYPMIPITISFFTKQAEQKHGNQLLLSLVYGLGIVAIFILIGVAFSGVIIPFATHPVTNLVIGIVFVFFAMALFGWITLQPPAFLMQAAGKASMRGGLIGVFLMGATLVVTSFTCTAPFVGSLLAVGASGGMTRVVLGMGVFGLTMAVPFVALSLVPRKLATMPKAGEWMHVLKVFMGFVELAAALKFISNADIQWGWGLLSRELFLILWAGIFVVAAVFLFGMIRMKGEAHDGIGPGRLVAATATFLFALYCWYALENKPVGFMTAIVPNYSLPLRAGVGEGEEVDTGDHLIVKDDYDAARQLAADKGLALLVNFTGHT